FSQTAYWYQLSYCRSTTSQGLDRMSAEKSSAVMTSAWRGSRYFPAGVLVSFESSHMQLRGMRVRKPEVGSAIKHRPPGRRTRKISLRTALRFATIRKSRETTTASMESDASLRA